MNQSVSTEANRGLTSYKGHQCKATVLGRCDGEVLALTRRGASVTLRAQYILDLREIVEQHELILLHPHPFTVPSFVATNPLT